MKKNDPSPISPNAEFLDCRQLAGLLRCSVRTVHRLIEAGQLPKPVRIGSGHGRFRWNAGDVRQDLLDAEGVALMLGVSKRSVFRWVALGTFPACPLQPQTGALEA